MIFELPLSISAGKSLALANGIHVHYGVYRYMSKAIVASGSSTASSIDHFDHTTCYWHHRVRPVRLAVAMAGRGKGWSDTLGKGDGKGGSGHPSVTGIVSLSLPFGYSDFELLRALARVIHTLGQARESNVTTEEQHEKLLKGMGDSADMLMQRLATGSFDAGCPYRSMMTSLRQAANAEVIDLKQLKELVKRVKSSEWDFEQFRNRYIGIIDSVFPEYASREASVA